jgi:hypothetical protein
VMDKPSKWTETLQWLADQAIRRFIDDWRIGKQKRAIEGLRFDLEAIKAGSEAIDPYSTDNIGYFKYLFIAAIGAYGIEAPKDDHAHD